MDGQSLIKKKIDFSDVVYFKSNIIDNWKPWYEAWPFQFGDEICMGGGFCGSAYITRFFRKELKIRPYAPFTCFAPVTLFTCMLLQLVQNRVDVEIIRLDQCSLCTTTKASLLQVIMGVGVPLLSAPLTCFYVADRLMTYPVPSITRAPTQFYNLWSRMVRKNPRPFFISAAIQVVVATIVTTQKQDFFWNFMKEE